MDASRLSTIPRPDDRKQADAGGLAPVACAAGPERSAAAGQGPES